MCHIKSFVLSCSTSIISILHKDWNPQFARNDHVRLYVLEKYWNSYNYDRIATKLWRIYATNMTYSNRSKKCFDTWHTADQRRLMPGKFHLKFWNLCIKSDILLTFYDYRSKHKLQKNSEFCEFAFDLHPICTLSQLKTWLAINDEIRA